MRHDAGNIVLANLGELANEELILRQKVRQGQTQKFGLIPSFCKIIAADLAAINKEKQRRISATFADCN